MKPNKFLKSRPAIYGIRNLTNGKLYVGKTHCMYRRCQQYVYAFKNEKFDHMNLYLFNAIKKSGLSNFEMFVLEFCISENLAERELAWMQNFNTTNHNCGYNLRMDSSSGMLAHANTRLKISANLKRQWSDGVRSAHSEKLKASWLAAETSRRVEQSERFRKSRTKFEYVVEHPDGTRERCAYLRLKEMGLAGAVGNMSRSKNDSTLCNGHVVHRNPVGEPS